MDKKINEKEEVNKMEAIEGGLLACTICDMDVFSDATAKELCTV